MRYSIRDTITTAHGYYEGIINHCNFLLKYLDQYVRFQTSSFSLKKKGNIAWSDYYKVVFITKVTHASHTLHCRRYTLHAWYFRLQHSLAPPTL